MNKIILQNETITKKIKAFINTLAKNSKIYDAFNEKQINIIRDNIINLAEENNYWQTIFNGQGASENSDNDSDDALDSIVFLDPVSSFTLASEALAHHPILLTWLL